MGSLNPSSITSQAAFDGMANTSYIGSDPNQMHFGAIKEAVEVAKSKAKPKILTLATSCGRTMKLLC